MRMPTLFRLLAFLRPFVAQVALSILLSAITIASNIGLLGTSAYLIASAALQPSIAELQVAIVGVRFFGLSRGVFRYLERLVSHSLNFKLLANMRVWFYTIVEPLAPAGLQWHHSSDLLNTAIADVETLENFYIRAVAPPLTAFLIFCGAILLVYPYHPSLALALTIGLLISGLGIPLITHLTSQRANRQLIAQRAQFSIQVIDLLQGSGDLTAFGRAQAQHDLAILSGRQVTQAQQKLSQSNAWGNALNLLVSNLSLGIILALSIPLVRAGFFDGVGMAVVSLIALAAFEATMPLSLAAQNLQGCISAAERLFNLADTPQVSSDPIEFSSPPRSMHIRLRDLCFTYPSERLPALQHIDIDLPPGKRLALIGNSGAGKTTLVNLLLRFWDCTPGTILVDGQDLRRYKATDIRSQISVVSQNAFFFSGTLAENLRIAAPNALDDKLWQSLQDAQIDQWIKNLPQGINTWIGEQGLQISGGERQRLAIARALLREAPLMVFDEPTAQLDTPTAHQLIDTLLSITAQHSVIWITHQLYGLDQMDEILVMNKGEVIERGNHQALIQKNGHYARMQRIYQNILDWRTPRIDADNLVK